MQNRFRHRQQAAAFLQEQVGGPSWELDLPPSGRGHETYIARSSGRGHGCRYFVKLGAHLPRYQVMASLGLTPDLIASGHLGEGPSILVQPYIDGRNPSWQEFHRFLPQIADVVNRTHHSPTLKDLLPPTASQAYRDAGLAAVGRVQQKWELHRPQVPGVADYVDDALSDLRQEIETFVGSGLVASHNDICKGNWLISSDGRVYLVDLEAMSLDDPAHDLGALLWWYYPPKVRPRFLERAGYSPDTDFQNRMRVRMALHCLDILLPRIGSFDRFHADRFADDLVDFRAVVAGRENPQGYGAAESSPSVM